MDDTLSAFVRLLWFHCGTIYSQSNQIVNTQSTLYTLPLILYYTASIKQSFLYIPALASQSCVLFINMMCRRCKGAVQRTRYTSGQTAADEVQIFKLHPFNVSTGPLVLHQV